MKKRNNIKNDDNGFFYEMQYKKILGIEEKNNSVARPFELGENERFLYLNEIWHSKAWIEGGVIPLNLASTYKSTERSGTNTPDENIIHNSSVDLRLLSPMIYIDPSKGGVKNSTMTGCTFNGIPIPNILNADFYHEDGIVLCMSKVRDTKIATRFGNKKCCLKILDIEKLKNVIDMQIGVAGKLQDCAYTDNFQRDHFLKSTEDSWQNETRIFWAAGKSAEVLLPPGIAEMIEEYNY